MTQPPTEELLHLQAALAGEYSIARELGRGGMGIVYLARDVQLDRDVAIKILPPQLATAATRERFLREARTAAGLSHPHIVPIHRVGEADGFVFFVMSYIEGETLGERLRNRGPLPPADLTRIMREVAWALAYAHGRGIVHRDVKPDNILLEAGTGRAMVTDFGIAHAGHDSGPVKVPGKVAGTAHYMSPEQATGDPVDGRSDIYSLGVVGYVALSGRLPFEADNLPALILKQATQAPGSVMQAAPGLPPSLGNAIDRCLEREPDDRFPDGEALADRLMSRGEGLARRQHAGIDVYSGPIAQRALEALNARALTVDSSIIVASGNGVHLYWLLDQPHLIDDAGDPPAIETEWVEMPDGRKKPRKYFVEGGDRVYLEQRRHVSRLSPKAQRLQDILAGIAKACGGDHTTDLSRLLRIPGTFNRKDQRNGREPVPTALIECDRSRRYAISVFEGFATPAPETERARQIEAMPLPKPRKTSASKGDKLAELVAASAIAPGGSRSRPR